MNELNDDQLFEELLNLKVEVVSDIDDVELTPIYDEYFSSKVFDLHSDEFDYIEDTETKASDSSCWDGYKQIGMKRGKSGKMVPNCVPIDEKSAKQKLKDPKGGLTSAGRAFFKRTEGADLKPGVKGAADTPEKMRRKGSFLTRFFTNPSGPMVDEKGRATRLALSAAAWGERVPKNAEDAAKLAAKGKKLLERYADTKKKNDEVDTDSKQLPGQTLGQQGSGAIGAGDAGDGVDRDGDGVIFDGTDKETRAPYKRQSNSDYEKRRRKFVRGQLGAQGIKPNRDVADRSKKERDARARARAQFDRQTYADGIRSQQDAARKRSNDSITDSAQRVERNRGFGNVTDSGRRSLPPSAGERNDISKAKPDTTNIGKAKPDTTNIGKAKPDTTNIGKAKPDTTNIGKAKPDRTNIGGDRGDSAGRGDRGRSGIANAKPDTTNIGKAKPDTTNIGQARPDRTNIGQAKPDTTNIGGQRSAQKPEKPRTGISQAKPDSTNIGRAKPGTTNIGQAKPDSTNISKKPEREYRRRDDIRPIGNPTIDRPRIGESRGGGRPTIDRPRLPGNQYKRTAGKNRNIRDF